MKRRAYKVRLLRRETGEQHERLIFADNEASAKERAVERAKLALRTPMADRTYAQFDVLSCVARS